jgi:uncharacterized protein (DUF885 family)
MVRSQFITAVLTSALLAPPLVAQARRAAPNPPAPLAASELRDTVALFTADRAGLLRRYTVEYSPSRQERLRAFYGEWRARLDRMDFDRLGTEGRVDWILLGNRVRREQDQLDRDQRLLAEMAPLVPFAETVMALEESRRRMETVNAAATATTLAALAGRADSLGRALREAGRGAAATSGHSASTPVPRSVALRAAGFVDDLQRTLRDWNRFYDGYDPAFSWWSADPYRRANDALRRYGRTLRETLVGQREGEEEPIVGDPIGVEAVRAELAYEMIPYTPEELIALAERELAWCETEYRRAAHDMGLGDDWRAALERVKQTIVEPGRQPDLIRDLAREAVAFVRERDLVTVPPLAEEIWRMEMMPAEQQRVSPFFLGGEVIRVSYPTDSMTNDDKLMSMRGNNPHFSRATVFHELIPGHHLQGFMTARYNPHREAFGTPFWGEGWALYWEMLMWDLGFPRGPEDRMGMLFWRAHRAARIIFSLKFHLGQMTPQEAIDLLVDRVGHERANATAEVRRSFNGTYGPLYQAAYMVGGLQFRALHAELVGTGRMTERQFHDAVLQGGRMPVEMVRARLLGTPLARDFRTSWRFLDAAGGR